MERKMAENLVGNLFGVDIHLPLKRSEVRDLIVARDNFIKNLMEQKNLNEMQASLDASDMLNITVLTKKVEKHFFCYYKI